MKFFDLRLPFFRSFWRRAITVALAGGWSLFELFTGSPGWAILFGSVAVYCAYVFFVTFNPDDFEEKE